MSILADKNTRVVVQGITGREGSFHTRQMMAYGTSIVAGTNPRKGGQKFDDQVPIFATVREAVEQTGANAAVAFVPPRFAPDAILESADAGIALVVCLTEYIPVLEMVKVRAYLDGTNTRLIGPNCPGLITPEQAKLGIIPSNVVMPGSVGIVSKSGTLTYEVIGALTHKGVGQSTCVGIGGDPIQGTDFIDCLRLFQADDETEQIVLMGEIGGNAEELAAAYIKEHVTKPVYAFIAGRTAPPGRRMGHAGAIVEGNVGTAESKMEALTAAGVVVVDHPDQFADVIS